MNIHLEASATPNCITLVHYPLLGSVPPAVPLFVNKSQTLSTHNDGLDKPGDNCYSKYIEPRVITS